MPILRLLITENDTKYLQLYDNKGFVACDCC